MSFYTNFCYFLAGFEEPGLGFALEVFGFRIDRFSCNGLLPMRTGFGSLLFITITSLIKHISNFDRWGCAFLLQRERQESDLHL